MQYSNIFNSNNIIHDQLIYSTLSIRLLKPKAERFALVIRSEKNLFPGDIVGIFKKKLFKTSGTELNNNPGVYFMNISNSHNCF